eukprot:scaffold3658_cov72-Skeletonema_dohrnii-CCMP3373.AAC.1
MSGVLGLCCGCCSLYDDDVCFSAVVEDEQTRWIQRIQEDITSAASVASSVSLRAYRMVAFGGGGLFRRMVMKAAAAAERHHGMMMCRWRFKIQGSDVA